MKIIYFLLISISTCFLIGCDYTADYNSKYPKDIEQIPGMSYIPYGIYYYGDIDQLNQVSIDEFHIDQYEVSVAHYKKCVDSGKCSAPITWTQKAGCSYGTGNISLPVNCVTINQARDYCASVGKRLPTDAEWEYVAKGILYANYPWGNDFDRNLACFNRKSSCDIGMHEPTVFGMRYADAHLQWPDISPIYDLAGNIAELVDSDYDQSNKRCANNCAVRGGSYAATNSNDVSTTQRVKINAAETNVTIGFRCAK